MGKEFLKGICPVCGAKDGEPCIPEDGFLATMEMACNSIRPGVHTQRLIDNRIPIGIPLKEQK